MKPQTQSMFQRAPQRYNHLVQRRCEDVLRVALPSCRQPAPRGSMDARALWGARPGAATTCCPPPLLVAWTRLCEQHAGLRARSTLSLPPTQCSRGTRHGGETCADHSRRLTCVIACVSQVHAAQQWRRGWWRAYYHCDGLSGKGVRISLASRASPCQIDNKSASPSLSAAKDPCQGPVTAR